MASNSVRSNFDAYINSAEMHLLLAGCRRVLGNLEVDALRSAAEKPINGAVFFDHCQRHGLALLGFKTVIKPFRDLFSSKVFERFELEVGRQTFHHVRLSKLLVDLHRELNQLHVPHAYLKGPILGAELFGEDLLRQCKDLDLLVESPDMMTALDCLESLGFPPKPPFERRHFWLHKASTNEITCMNKSSGCVVDVHWKTDLVETVLLPNASGRESDFKRVHFHGEEVTALSGTQNCLFLCHHGARHHWFRLRWLLDIPLLMRKENVDVQTLLHLAEDRGIRRSVEEALYLSAKLFGVEQCAGSTTITPSKSRRMKDRIERGFTPKAEWKSGPLTTHHRILLYSGIGTKLRLWCMLLLKLFMNRVLKW